VENVENENNPVAAGSAIRRIAGNLFDAHQRRFVPGDDSIHVNRL
jgi:hypothetical protein